MRLVRVTHLKFVIYSQNLHFESFDLIIRKINLANKSKMRWQESGLAVCWTLSLAMKTLDMALPLTQSYWSQLHMLALGASHSHLHMEVSLAKLPTIVLVYMCHQTCCIWSVYYLALIHVMVALLFLAPLSSSHIPIYFWGFSNSNSFRKGYLLVHI